MQNTRYLREFLLHKIIVLLNRRDHLLELVSFEKLKKSRNIFYQTKTMRKGDLMKYCPANARQLVIVVNLQHF